MKKLVSIIVPIYNRENTIQKCIESITNQTYSELEIIIVDDGSTDNTYKICEKFLKDDRIKLFRKENGGVSSARNYGIHNSTGEYIVFVDSDDICDDNMIMVAIEKIENYDLLCFNYRDVYSNKIIHKSKIPPIEVKSSQDISKAIFNLEKYGGIGQPWNKIFKSDIIKNNNIGFNETISFGEDFRFNLDYISKISTLKIIEESLYECHTEFSGLARKYQLNKFEIMIDNTNYYLQFLKENGIQNEERKQRYYNDLIGGINNLFYADCPLTKKEKIINIKKYINNNYIIDNIKVIKKSNIFYYFLVKNNKSHLIYILHRIKKIIKGS